MLRIYKVRRVKYVENTNTKDDFLSLKSVLPASNMTYCATPIKIFTEQKCSAPRSNTRQSLVS